MTLQEWQACPVPGYDPWATAAEGDWFDIDRANLCLAFIETHLQIVEGDKVGQPLNLEPWQLAIVGNLFGWKRADGTRRYRIAFIYIPRKNGKTVLSAVIAILVLFLDNDGGAQLCSLASNKDQAFHAFRFMKLMLEASPELSSRVTINRSKQMGSIVYHATNATFRTLSSLGPGNMGAGANLALIDEVHAHRTPDAVVAIRTSRSARKQPILMFLTTADYDLPSYCNDEYKRASDVRDGVVPNREYLPVIFEALPDDDWTAEQTWYKANPNLGVSKEIEYMRSECSLAKISAQSASEFKRLDLNLRVPSIVQWIDPKAWERCGWSDPRGWRERMLEDLAGQNCCGGFDLSSVSDLTALALIFRREGKHIILPWFWTPEDKVLEKTKADGIPYEAWVDEGWIETTPGNRIDQKFIRRRFNEIIKPFQFGTLAFDRWAADNLVRAGLADEDGIQCVEFPQGFAMSEHCKRFETAVNNGEIEHGGNPVLKWMASNVVVKDDSGGNGAIALAKGKSKGKIDGIVAAIMGLAQFHAVYGENETAPMLFFR